MTFTSLLVPTQNTHADINLKSRSTASSSTCAPAVEAWDLWTEEMEIPLTVIHNQISIRQAGRHGYNDYFQSISLKDEKSIF